MENSELGLNQGDSHMKDDEFEALLQSLPKEPTSIPGLIFYCYQGFWYTRQCLKNTSSYQKQFQARNDDLLLASSLKSGTTWLKALSFSIVNRSRFPLSETPLLTANPHALVLNMEFDVFDKPETIASLSDMQSPRLLCTHVPYSMLPPSVRNSHCKIVYICRNAMDQFVSSWYFSCKIYGKDPSSISEDYFDRFCRGAQPFGPFWDHVLEFWKASLEKPDKILFIKYEDLKKDTVSHVKQLAEFLGFPFTEEEEKQRVAEEIVKFCSIENMKTLEGNVHGKRPMGTPNSSFFRKGEVGDWENHLTPSMADRLKKIIQEKLEGSSLQMF